MTINDLTQAVVQNGIATVIISYFLYRDYKYTAQLIILMSELKTILHRLNDGERED